MSVAITCDQCGKPIHEVAYCMLAFDVTKLVGVNPQPMYTYDFHAWCIAIWTNEHLAKRESDA